jgi:hypothetical protein
MNKFPTDCTVSYHGISFLMLTAVRSSELTHALVPLTGYKLHLPSTLVNSIFVRWAEFQRRRQVHQTEGYGFSLLHSHQTEYRHKHFSFKKDPKGYFPVTKSDEA